MRWRLAVIQTPEETLEELGTSLQGLGSDAMKERLLRYGPNQLEEQKIRWWRTLLRQFQSSFIYLLLAATLLSFALGERFEAGMMLLFISINAALGFIQEHRSAKTLALLKQYLVSKVRVRREGSEQYVESPSIVPGDIVLVEAGDKIPADMRFIESNNLVIDEEVLTGESVNVDKVTTVLSKETSQMYQAANIGFAGTLVMRGRGVGAVVATGKETAMGEIANLVQTTDRESSFEKGIQRFSRFILRLVVVTLTLVFLANVVIKGEGADVPELLIFSLVLVVSVIPEALPFVTTVSLSRGSLRLAKKKVVVKRLAAIEDLGSIEVLCTDKTGTLTENKLTVEKLFAEDREMCLRLAAIASIYGDNTTSQKPADPFDTALWNKLSLAERERVSKIERIEELPFDPVRRRNSVLIRYEGEHQLIVRGAPETILELSGNVSPEKKREYLAWMAAQGESGRRVLSVARKNMSFTGDYTEQDEHDMDFLGLISFIDPLKGSAKEALDQARLLGVKVKIVTGDSKEVSGAVAYQIGLIHSPHEVISGEDLEGMTHAQMVEAVEKYSVFARVSPQQKYAIIQVLQERFEVGFLGEGINDAPALKLANVALAVSGASDIAREAADVVLLEHSLKVIVDGIKEGRSIFANMIKYIKITLTSNFGNFYSVALVSLLIPFVPMLPLQILLIDILSDLPMIAISTDTVDTDELKKPKSYQVKDTVLVATLLGVVSSVFDFILFAHFYQKTPAMLQTNWFILSLLTELVLIFSLRSRLIFFQAKKPSLLLMGLSFCIALLSIAIPLSHFGQSFFQFLPPSSSSFLWIFSLVIGYFFATETVKRIYYRAVKA